MPTPTMTVDPEAVTPGFVGFAVIVIILIAVILLIWDMNRRIRRVRYREEVREELDAEQAAIAAQESAAHDPGEQGPDAATSAPEDGDERTAR